MQDLLVRLRQSDWRGRGLFILGAYAIYAFVFYGLWIMDGTTWSVVSVVARDYKVVARALFELPAFYQSIIEGIRSPEPDFLIVLYFFVVAPLLTFLMPFFIGKILGTRKTYSLYACSLGVSLVLIVYMYLYVSFALAMTLPGL